MDLELKRILEEKGLSFKDIFAEIFVFASAIFIGFTAKDYLTEVIETFSPRGQSLVQKGFILMGIFIVLIILNYFVIRRMQKKKS